MKQIIKKRKRPVRAVYVLLSLTCLVLIWQLASVTVFKNSSALPPPLRVARAFFSMFSDPDFYRAVSSTLGKSVTGFALSFILGIILSVFARLFIRFRYFCEPVLSILRSVPTLGVTFILLIFYPSSTATVVVGALVTLPLIYANGFAALNNIDEKLVQMARVYKVGKLRQVTGIYLPACTPYLFSSLLGGFGLNLKVTIAAEIVSIPRLTLGSGLHAAYSSANFALLFAWVITAVALNFVCEGLIQLTMRLCMPYKYSTRKRIAGFFKRITRKKETDI